MNRQRWLGLLILLVFSALLIWGGITGAMSDAIAAIISPANLVED